MDPVQSTAGKVILETPPEAEPRNESTRWSGRMTRACRSLCCSVQTDDRTEPDKNSLEKSGSQSPKLNGPVVRVSDTSVIASQETQVSDSSHATGAPTDTGVDSSLPASEPSGGQRRGSADSGAGNLAGGAVP